MSYPYQQGGGYPQPGGFPQPGGAPGYPQPQPGGGQAPYPTSASGGLPYAYKPPDIGFSGAGSGAPGVAMPMPGGAPPGGQPTYQVPMQGGAYNTPQPGYGGYNQPPAQQPGYPGQSQGGYPGQAPPAQAGYPGQPPQQAGYPGQQPPQQSGYPGQQPPQQAGYPGQQPPQQAGYPGQQPPQQAGYPGQQPPQQAGYPGQQPPQQAGYAGQQPGYSSAQQPSGYGAPHGSSAPGMASASAQHQPGAGSVYPTDAMKNLSIRKPMGEGTVKPYPNFNAEQDAGVLRKAMKGAGTDEKAIIDVVCYRSNAQRQEIKKMFKTCYGKDLIKELKSELSKNFERVIVRLIMTPAEFDAEQLRNCIEGAGTDEDGLIEVLCTRTNAEIMEIRAMYKTLFKRDLEKDLMSDTSGHFRRLMVSLCNAGRNENPQVDIEKAKRDAKELYKAGEGKLGTDESKFNQFLCAQSFEQLQALFNEYRNVSSKTIEKVIKSEMSGDLEDGMLAIVRIVEGRPNFFAERLYKSMKGAGTRDRQLMRIMISRCEVDMVQIKQIFQAKYGKTLESFIEGDTSGDYKRALLALCGRK